MILNSIPNSKLIWMNVLSAQKIAITYVENINDYRNEPTKNKQTFEDEAKERRKKNTHTHTTKITQMMIWNNNKLTFISVK